MPYPSTVSACLAVLFVVACTDPGEDIADAAPTSDVTGLDASLVDSGADPDSGASDQDSGPDLDSGALDAGADAALIDSGRDSGSACDDVASTYVTVDDPPAPPVSGTLFVSSTIMSEADPTSLVGIEYAGQDDRVMFDRRTASFETYNAHLFNARYGAATTVEIQVNPEFDMDAARGFAMLYGEAIGRLPAFYFEDLETVWIHDGEELAGGGNNNILIHTIQGERYIADGIIEELLLHEGAHTSLDSRHADDPAWLAAQRADGTFLSTYARDNPGREDVAETIGPWLAVRFFRDRIDPDLATLIETTIPNRLRYWDCAQLSPDTLP